MRRAIIAMFAVASGFSQAEVRSIGLHQYIVTDAGKQVFAKANETCVKLGRTMMPLGVPPEEAGIAPEKQFKFECILAYEIVPNGGGTYTIHVPTQKMLAPVEGVCPTCKFPATRIPDMGNTYQRLEQLARMYCAKTNEIMVVTGGGFDMGPGLRLIFKCVPPQQANVH